MWFAISGVVLVDRRHQPGESQGLNKGIDFTGGSQFTFNVPTEASTSSVTNTFNSAGISDPVVQGVGKSVNGGYTQFQVKSHALPGTVQNKLISKIAATYHVAPNSIDSKNVSCVVRLSRCSTPAYLAIVVLAADHLRSTSSFRFEWRYAVPGDGGARRTTCMITLGIYSLSQREVTADTVAAVLTVLGYSLYDTVIVFDRVRENIPILRADDGQPGW